MTIKRALEVLNTENPTPRSKKAMYKALNNLNFEDIEGYCELHHSARSRGYVHSGRPYISLYQGRFGNGFIYHYPNNQSCRKSNQYHDIEYWIVK